MSNLLSPVERYYSDKLAQFGARPQGVDWNGQEGQVKRFEQLCKLLPEGGDFSVADVGCGYGALLDFLSQRSKGVNYIGLDISAAMIEAAARLHAQEPNAKFIVGTKPEGEVEFAIASGIFNVKLGADAASWSAYIVDTLESMDAFTTKGFSFNCLTGYSDPERMRSDLHYADPCELFDLCKRRFARNVALLHDYDLYEFTILVRK
ncbi:class I SAM-dependent methyltransferase [Paraburkholderia sp. CNPSo 3272]|uniref:class I SAM-dependent methyltransferase n=1 Tax=Paraburkholderia sp. CNPSo 3272 TaxID=2940931 RepID=UPI0020B6AD23|nr:class I SAM-dependent methyltransferase [Paraburkholderia sp. CNPSo 3272]MCP3726173.1 class I SAM-dependent methyltransferase [Paraburkholderia sp. CNPSo 3272]